MTYPSLHFHSPSPPPHSLCSSWTSPSCLTVTANSCIRAFAPLLGNTPDLFLLLNLRILTEVSLPLKGLPREQNSLLPYTLHHVILFYLLHRTLGIHHLTYVYVSLGTSFLECEHRELFCARPISPSPGTVPGT